MILSSNTKRLSISMKVRSELQQPPRGRRGDSCQSRMLAVAKLKGAGGLEQLLVGRCQRMQVVGGEGLKWPKENLTRGGQAEAVEEVMQEQEQELRKMKVESEVQEGAGIHRAPKGRTREEELDIKMMEHTTQTMAMNTAMLIIMQDPVAVNLARINESAAMMA